jgi:NADPH:quinone reductase-like Zn-dependent oxidoreductase
MGTPLEGQILVKNHAIALNPIDNKIQSRAIYEMSYPTILGEDVAGEVVSVGPGVTLFKPGDRVCGTTAGFATKSLDSSAFQAYTVLDTQLTSRIPDGVPYESAVVIPLGFTTASAGLFNADQLGLQLPSRPARAPTGATLLVWGGASSVGCNAIQLASAAGYEVITTASAKNFDLVKKLGASHVFDYKSPTIVSDLEAAFGGKALAGVYDAVGGPAMGPILDFIVRVQGNRFIATVVPGFPEPPEGVCIGRIQSLTIRTNGIGKAVWNDFLPQALAEGTFVPAPDPFVAGKGLESIQGAMDILNEGVSAQKVVVTL